ncbi:hypothetical protein LIER_27107 [Lithospermum erythrorhizon]|uniref:Protein FAR1-RELATED SEQUENCE n=1 Tax=Lithospermum erythrorhizon TaxID=34254 RepID=A0AAV3RAU7_LITER
MSAGDLSILLSLESETKPSFFYDIQLDEESLITNMFLSDGVMQHDYSCFGDVVSMDTTFRTNKECFPLVFGFSHNRQSCVFGVALLHDQTSDTFEWLLHVFLKCMQDKRPVTILTDQDAAMKKTISIVLPDGFHGLDERQVVIDLESGDWSCSCRMFVQWGILCCHILKAIDILGSSCCYADLRVIPDRYLLKRWSRKARGDVGTWTLPKTDGNCYSSYGLRHQAFCSSMIRVSSRICIDDDTYCFFMKEVNDILARVEERLNVSSNVAAPSSMQSISTDDALLQN